MKRLFQPFKFLSFIDGVCFSFVYIAIGGVILHEHGWATFQKNCLKEHLIEAITQNEERKPLYAQVSQGRSLVVSDLLIGAERALLPFAGFILDDRAFFWQSQGIPVGCLDFMPMHLSPSFSAQGPTPQTKFAALTAKQFANMYFKVFSAVAKINTEGTENHSLLAVHQEIVKLSAVPQYHCMKRHVLESIARTLYLLPQYNNESLHKGLKSPQPLLTRFLHAQVLSLTLSNEIDNKAGPLQQQGVPIVCRDVPLIPYGPLSGGAEVE